MAIIYVPRVFGGTLIIGTVGASTDTGIGMSNSGVGNDDAPVSPDDAMFYLYQVGLTSRGGYMPPPKPRKIKK
jgi:hypothetical protein